MANKMTFKMPIKVHLNIFFMYKNIYIFILYYFITPGRNNTSDIRNVKHFNINVRSASKNAERREN